MEENKKKAINVKLSDAELAVLLEILLFTKEAAYTIMLASTQIDESTKDRMKKVAHAAIDLYNIFGYHIDIGEPQSELLN